MIKPYKRIDLSAIIPIATTLRKRVVATGAHLILNHWKSLADSSTLSDNSRMEYKRQLRIVGITDSKATIELYGESVLPNMFEQGMGPGGVGSTGAYDLRKFMLPAKRGFFAGKHYRAIPFKVTGRMVSEVATSPTRARASFAALAPTRTSARGAGGRGFGAALPAGLARRARPSDTMRRDASGKSYLARAHATDPLAGAYRFEKTYAKKTESHLGVKFRMMSTKGKPWMHPGIAPLNLAARVNVDSARLLNQAMEIVLGK